MKAGSGKGWKEGSGSGDCSRCEDDLLLAEREWEKRKGSLWGTRKATKSR